MQRHPHRERRWESSQSTATVAAANEFILGWHLDNKSLFRKVRSGIAAEWVGTHCYTYDLRRCIWFSSSVIRRSQSTMWQKSKYLDDGCQMQAAREHCHLKYYTIHPFPCWNALNTELETKATYKTKACIRCVCVCVQSPSSTHARAQHFPQWTRLPCSRATFHCESTVMRTMELCQIFWHSTNVWQTVIAACKPIQEPKVLLSYQRRQSGSQPACVRWLCMVEDECTPTEASL